MFKGVKENKYLFNINMENKLDNIISLLQSMEKQIIKI